MARQTKAEKLIDKQVEAAYSKHGHGVQINVMDLSKVMNAGRDAIKAGQNLDDVMLAALAKYRVN